MAETFDKNSKVEKLTNILGIAVRLIVIDPLQLLHSRTVTIYYKPSVYCEWPYFPWYQFSWIGLTYLWSLKLMVINFSFIKHTPQRNCYSPKLKFVEKTLNENHENWYLVNLKSLTVNLLIKLG